MSALARICIACRVAYDDGATCDGGDGHELLSLDDPAQRTRLIEAVWGDADERRRTQRRIRAESVRGQKLVLVSGAIGFATTVTLGQSAAFFGALGGAAIGGIAAHVARPREASTYPRGASPRSWPRPSARGRVRGGVDVSSPASGESCVAWGVELRFDGSWGERVMLRAGGSGGLEIALDGGEVLRVSAGPLLLAEPPQQVDELTTAGLTGLVHALDPLAGPGEYFTPLPHNVVAESMLFVGDRVEVLGALERVVAAGAGASALYRDAPRSQLAPRGLAILRRC